MKDSTCCICKKRFVGYGHNAEPIKKGQCCNACNVKVIEKRIFGTEKITNECN
mgnify:FL=1